MAVLLFFKALDSTVSTAYLTVFMAPGWAAFSAAPLMANEEEQTVHN